MTLVSSYDNLNKLILFLSISKVLKISTKGRQNSAFTSTNKMNVSSTYAYYGYYAFVCFLYIHTMYKLIQMLIESYIVLVMYVFCIYKTVHSLLFEFSHRQRYHFPF